MAVATQFRFPSRYTIESMIGPHPFPSCLLPRETEEKILKAVAIFVANHKKTREDVYKKAHEIIIQEAPDLSQNNAAYTAHFLTQNLMYIISDEGRMQWDINAPGRPVVLYDTPRLSWN